MDKIFQGENARENEDMNMSYVSGGEKELTVLTILNCYLLIVTLAAQTQKKR